ncbi:MAG TPA: hypothetical protein DEG17_17895 [Cyanobacteria bacterium UBA11149]|nr:hypothetical protein [Cyanobacteria bacterium UBA11149]
MLTGKKRSSWLELVGLGMVGIGIFIFSNKLGLIG